MKESLFRIKAQLYRVLKIPASYQTTTSHPESARASYQGTITQPAVNARFSGRARLQPCREWFQMIGALAPEPRKWLKRSGALAAAATFTFLLCPAQTTPAAPPVVTITAPANKSAYSWNSLVPYSVTVTWNGKSTQYQEIPSNEVLITTTYIPDLSKMASQPVAEPAPPGLLAIIRSGCIGCHEFKAKAMGPSFAAIAARFPDNPSSITTLSRYIREGSTGIFGPAAMPPHPQFTPNELQAIAQWIAKSAANPNINHYVGTEGTIRMQSPTPPTPNSGMALAASYTAPTQQSPHGQATVILHGR